MIQKEYIKPEFTIVILKPHHLLQISAPKTLGLDGHEGYDGEGEENVDID